MDNGLSGVASAGAASAFTRLTLSPVLLHVAQALTHHVFQHVAQEVCKKCNPYCVHVCLPSEGGSACRRVKSLPLPVGRCPRAGAEATQVTAVSLGKLARLASLA